MKYQEIAISQLEVNRSNDRHGEVVSEDAAMAWLLTHRANHMRNLAKDIVKSNEIYEPPLVRKENRRFVVYDGNRRTTTLKLLLEPQRSPSSDWLKFYTELREKWQSDFPTTIMCQIETDRERLDEILYRRHTGQKNGVGQSQWDAPAKTNFERRTGKNTKLDIAEAIEVLLKKKEVLSANEYIPRSNMKRLFSAEQFRNRVGISVERNQLTFTHNPEKVIKSLTKIARDLISKTITLDNLWDNEAKRLYLNHLDSNGLLPRVEDSLPSRISSTVNSNSIKKASSKIKPIQRERGQTLIRNLDHGLQQTHKNRKALDIFDELQHRLKFEDHDNAIAVLFRVLLEISIEICIEEWSISSIHEGDKLSNKFRKTLSYMRDNKVISKAEHSELKRFEQSEALFSTKTLHSYVHSPSFFPSDHHLKSMWDNLEGFVVLCLKPKPNN